MIVSELILNSDDSVFITLKDGTYSAHSLRNSHECVVYILKKLEVVKLPPLCTSVDN